MKRIFLGILIISLLTVFASLSFAVPVEFSFQGYLTDGGVPVDGVRNITFRLYDHATETQPVNLKWESLPIAVTITSGIYSVVLGDNGANPIDPAIFADQLWLGIEVESGGEMVPRQKLTSAAYSMYTQTAQTTESVSWSALSDKPSGFDDSIDNDTLGSLSCAIDQIAKWNGSAWVCVPPTVMPPAPPSGVTAIAGDGQVTISWSPVVSAESYNIYWNTTGGVTTANNAIINTSSPYIHLNLLNDTSYYYIVTAINVFGESGPSVELSATSGEIFSSLLQKIYAPDAQQNDYFGRSVSISGDYVIVGAPYERGGAGNPLTNAGAAYIFHRTGPYTWDAGTKIVASDIQSGDTFGYSVSISGDYAIVGAYGEDGGAGDPLADAGAAYIFHRTGTNTWDTGTKIIAPDAQAQDVFGWTVSISDDYAVVGAYTEDGGAGDPLADAGAAYIFHRTGTNTWDTGTKIVASDAQANDYFGQSVSISGDYTIVGALLEDSVILNEGAAYIFHRTGTNTWDSGTKIVAPEAQPEDRFGGSVSIDGDYAIVGADHEDIVPGDTWNNAGAAYIFSRTGANTWDTGTKIVASDAQPDDQFGYSVSISGDYAIVGALGEAGGAGDPLPYSGATYVFNRTGANTWNTGTKIVAPDAQAYDYFAISVSISGDYAVVGAYNEDGGDGDPLRNTGTAYIY